MTIQAKDFLEIKSVIPPLLYTEKDKTKKQKEKVVEMLIVLDINVCREAATF